MNDLQFNDDQMTIIIKALREGIDVKKYFRPELEWRHMNLILLGLKNNIEDLSNYNITNLDHYKYEILMEWLSSGYSIKNYLGHNTSQLTSILTGLKYGLNPSKFDNIEFNSNQIDVIISGILTGVDVSIYSDPNMDYRIMEIYRDGMFSGIDYSDSLKFYHNPEISKLIMELLKMGINVDVYLCCDLEEDVLKLVLCEVLHSVTNNKPILSIPSYNFSINQLNILLPAFRQGINAIEFIDPATSEESILLIINAIRSNIDISNCLDPKLSTFMVSLIITSNSNNIDISKYIKENYNEDQIDVILEGLIENVDVSIFDSIHNSAGQMRQILDGIYAGIDISKYKDINNSVENMRDIKINLILEKFQ